jgi:predicted nucleotidyltransferase
MLTELFGSRLRAKLLGWLLTHPDERFFVRQLAGLLDEDSTNISRELARLVRLAIVRSQSEGRQKYFQADPDGPAYAELRGLAIKSFGLADVLRESLRPLAGRIAAAFVYGSQAAGKASASSDVDVMVIGSASFGDVVSALAPAQQRLGREVNPTVYAPGELTSKMTAKHSFLTQVLAGTKVFLVGDERALAGLAQERLAGRARGDPARGRRPARRGPARPSGRPDFRAER